MSRGGLKVEITRLPRFLAPGRVSVGSAARQGLEAARPPLLAALKSQPNQPATIQAKWQTKVELSGTDARLVVTNAHPGAAPLDQGRKPGKQPPPAVMAAWAAKVLGDPRLGYVVGRKIGEQGIAARYWVRGAIQASRAEVKHRLTVGIITRLEQG